MAATLPPGQWVWAPTVAPTGPGLVYVDLSRQIEMINLHNASVVELTHLLLPPMIDERSGGIINISSTVGISSEALNGVYGATKAYVLALGHSLQHELANKGIRIQTVLPGATATEFWDIAGYPHQNMPASVVMSAEDMVDASLVGLDNGEVVTIPGLQDGDDWTKFEADRKAISKKFGNSVPAPRYRAKVGETV